MIQYLIDKYRLSNVTKLQGGYSFCEKFKSDQYVIKIFGINEYPRLIERMKYLLYLEEKRLSVPRVIGYGENGEHCYQILTYLEGDTGEEIASYPKDIQFNIGYEAGKELKTYHTYELPNQIDLYQFHKEKYLKMKQNYLELDIHFKYEQECIDYVEEHIDLLKGRTTYQLHGDYHAENMAFTLEGYVGAFDFERNKKTDYVREFERVLYFTRQYSIEFVKGFLKGYEFKEYAVLKLYLVMSIFNSFVWAAKYYPEQLDEFREYSRIVVEDFDCLRADKPLYVGE